SNPLGDFATVESLTLCLGDCFQGLGVTNAAENFPGAGRPPFRQEALGKTGLVTEPDAPEFPQTGNDGADSKTVTRILNGGLCQLPERQLAEAARKRDPGGDCTGHGDGVPSLLRH